MTLSIILGGLLVIIGILKVIVGGCINWASDRCTSSLEEHQMKLATMRASTKNSNLVKAIESITGLIKPIVGLLKAVSNIACGLIVAVGIIFIAIGFALVLAAPF